MTWLLGALGLGTIGTALLLVPGLAANVLKALGAALDVARRYPALIAIVLLCGVSGWLWWGKNAEHAGRIAAETGRAADRHAYTEAQVAAARLALAAKAATEARYKAHAQEIDREYQTQLADARDDARQYIASHRVRSETVGGTSGGTVASAQGGSPVVPVNLSASAVVVSERDVLACTDTATYALKAREWALGLAE